MKSEKYDGLIRVDSIVELQSDVESDVQSIWKKNLAKCLRFIIRMHRMEVCPALQLLIYLKCRVLSYVLASEV